MQPERPLVVPPLLLSRLAERFPGKPAEIGRWVRALSDAYVTERAPAPSGLGGTQYLSAYGRYYLPVNYLKFHVPLHELSFLPAADIAGRKTLRVLDVGAGLGTASLSLLGYLADAGASAESVSFVLWDRDEAALARGRELLRWWAGEVLPAARVEVRTLAAALGDVPSGAGIDAPYDLIVLGNCLAEWAGGVGADVADAARWIGALVKYLDGSGSLIVVEPALRSTSRFLHEVRDRLLERHVAHLYAPCLHERPCPALARERDWCHERLDWDLPDALAAVDRAAGLQKQTLAFSYLVLRREPGSLRDVWDAQAVDANHTLARVVSDVLVEKGKRGCIGCTQGGRRVYYEALVRSGSKAAAGVGALRRGDVAAFAQAPQRGDRARLAPDDAPLRKETPCRTKN